MPEPTNKVAVNVTLRPDQIDAIAAYGERQKRSPFEEVPFSAALREVVDVGLVAIAAVPPLPQQQDQPA